LSDLQTEPQYSFVAFLLLQRNYNFVNRLHSDRTATHIDHTNNLFILEVVMFVGLLGLRSK